MSFFSGLDVDQAGAVTALSLRDTLLPAERAVQEDADDGGAGGQGKVEGPVDNDQSLEAGMDAVHVGRRPPTHKRPAGTRIGGDRQSSRLGVAEYHPAGRKQECDAGAERE